ncbi:hypothetical protein J6590_069233, partial [Homalodisca vitripennis]
KVEWTMKVQGCRNEEVTALVKPFGVLWTQRPTKLNRPYGNLIRLTPIAPLLNPD